MRIYGGPVGAFQTMSSVAPENILIRGHKVTSLGVRFRLNRLSTSGQLFQFSGPSVEWLYVYHEEASGMEHRQSLPSLRELFVHPYPILPDRP